MLATLEMTILNIENEFDLYSVGKVLSNKDGIIEVSGLDDVFSGEVLEIGENSLGLVMNIERFTIKAIVLGDDTIDNFGRTLFKCITIFGVIKRNLYEVKDLI